MIKIADEKEFTTIQRYQCSKIFLASIHVAMIDKEVINESANGTGESVYLLRMNHITK